MKRRFLWLRSALSAALCVAALMLWLSPGRSWPADGPATPTRCVFAIKDRALAVRVYRAAAVPAVSPPCSNTQAYLKWYFALRSGPVFDVLGFEVARWPYFRGTPSNQGQTAVVHTGTFWEMKLPLLAVACLALFAPVVQFIPVLLPRKATGRRGHCRRCGYDLTANTSGVCPECGTATTAGTAVSQIN